MWPGDGVGWGGVGGVVAEDEDENEDGCCWCRCIQQPPSDKPPKKEKESEG